jgi:hypothetical protein
LCPNGFVAGLDIRFTSADARLTRRSASANETGTSNVAALIASGAKIPLGEHDVTLTKVAGKWRGDGLEREEIEAALIRFCQERCEGHGADFVEMCQKIAKSVCRYPAGDPTPTVTIGGKLRHCSGRDSVPCLTV